MRNNATQRAYNGLGTEAVVSSVASIDEDHNDFFGKVSGFTRGLNDLNTPPGYEFNSNLNIPTNSPLVDRGGETTQFNYDIRGFSRPLGPAWDIGAYEASDVPVPKSPTINGIASGE